MVAEGVRSTWWPGRNLNPGKADEVFAEHGGLGPLHEFTLFQALEE